MDLAAELDFGKGNGLVTAIAVDDPTGDILMVAFMNEAAFRATVETGEVHYWSRSRNALWRKGEQSGNTQKVQSLWLDCDGDVVVVRVDQQGGAACHTGRRSCFYRRADGGRWVEVGERVFDPDDVYGR